MTVQLHPGSLFAGLGLAVVAFIAMGQQSVATSPRVELDSSLSRPPAVAPVQPKEWFEIVEGQPYLVPAGKLLVVRALGSGSFIPVELKVDGSTVAATDPSQFGSTIVEIPRLLTVVSGAVVEPDSTSGEPGRAWCYLADA